MLFYCLILLCLGYFLGSIPFGYILTKRVAGLNILELGSGNIGSTNVRRNAGSRLSIVVQVLDILKGIIPVSMVFLLEKTGWCDFPEYFVFLVAISPIIGHISSVFLHFRGGKGVNTTIGAAILLAPLEITFAVVLYFLVKWQTKYVSAGSIALAISLPVSGAILSAKIYLEIFLLICCFLILFRHKANIRRLMAGNELK